MGEQIDAFAEALVPRQPKHVVRWEMSNMLLTLLVANALTMEHDAL